MSNQKSIDIIIPAYRAQKTIEKALASIFMQSIVDEVKVIIVNDADGIGYNRQIRRFKDKMEILELTMPKNSGCGPARQYGIDNSNSPLIVFLDADDYLHHAFALEMLRNSFKTCPDSAFAVGDFLEIVGEGAEKKFVDHRQDFIWMFAKIYSREYLEKYKIRFSSVSANEDNGFNTMLQLIMSINEEKVATLGEFVYVWEYNAKSITRTNDYEYTYNQSVYGYKENMKIAIDHVNKFFPDHVKIYMKIIEVMVNLYIMCMRTSKFRNEFKQHNIDCCLDFYKNYFKLVKDLVTPESMEEQVIKNLSAKRGMLEGFIPEYTINQFFDFLSSLDF